MGEILGDSEQGNTAKKNIAKYRSITEKLPNTTILKYRVETQCHSKTTILYVKFRVNNNQEFVNERNEGNFQFDKKSKIGDSHLHVGQ